MPEHPHPKPRPHPFTRAAPPVDSGIAAKVTTPSGPSSPLPPILRAPPAPTAPPPYTPSSIPYAELHVTSNYTFLTGASHPDELIQQAAALGYRAIAITDRNSVAGIVRAHVAAKEAGIPLIVGARIDAARDESPSLPSSPLQSILLFPTSRPAYAAMCRLLTLGKRRAPKGQCHLVLHDLLEAATNDGGEDLLAVIIPPVSSHALDEHFIDILRGLKRALCPNGEDRLSLAASFRFDGHDDERLAQLADLAEHVGIPLVATGDVLYHTQDRAPLQDVLTCIRHGCTLNQAGTRLEPSAERYLKDPAHIARLFARYPCALARTVEIASRCTPSGAHIPAISAAPFGSGPQTTRGFSLDFLRYEYPGEVIPPNTTAMQHLTELTWQGARERYPKGVPAKVASQILHELKLIDELAYAHYFLTVHDLVRFARSRNILCQGRGAAANSAVCYMLGVTAVDPDRIDVLFERFISKERNEPPDIDIDFEHERREEVIQYIYAKYGRDRAALTAEVISYRSKSAIRDVGKALGLSLDAVDAIAKNVDWWEKGLAWSELNSHESRQSKTPFEQRLRELGFSPQDPTIIRLLRLGTQILGFPRHLSQHVGGFVITQSNLSDLVPIENAAMDERTVIEWDKDDIDAAGMLKIDVLGLGMLTCIRKAFELVKSVRSDEPLLELHTIPPEDPAVYDMICAADTVGVFQIESRAQMSMLPRLKPRCFYDLVIEVAIVRPGPIQGNMVHPYLRRRNGEEPVEFPDEAVKRVLAKTLGVPLFQEQAMTLSIVAAGFTPGEADQLRRAIAAWKTKQKLIYHFGQKIIEGMTSRGYPLEFAQRCFDQIKGFSEYGFPESHAASFALLVYASAWLKLHYPAEFAAALINSQPMGFYAPAQIVQDAQRHGARVRRVDVNESGWDCSMERRDDNQKQSDLRLGLRLVQSLGEAEGRKVERAVKEHGGFESIDELWRKSGVKVKTLRALADADAFGSMSNGSANPGATSMDRQHALWAIAALRDESLPLLDRVPGEGGQAEKDAPRDTAGKHVGAIELPPVPAHLQVVHDYASIGLSLKAHPVSFVRDRLTTLKAIRSAELTDSDRFPQNSKVALAGIVLGRQRPSTAKGIMFITIEDETGPANLIVRPRVYEQYRAAARHSVLMLVRGHVERQGLVIHVIARKIENMGHLMNGLEHSSRDFH